MLLWVGAFTPSVHLVEKRGGHPSILFTTKLIYQRTKLVSWATLRMRPPQATVPSALRWRWWTMETSQPNRQKQNTVTITSWVPGSAVLVTQRYAELAWKSKTALVYSCMDSIFDLGNESGGWIYQIEKDAKLSISNIHIRNNANQPLTSMDFELVTEG